MIRLAALLCTLATPATAAGVLPVISATPPAHYSPVGVDAENRMDHSTSPHGCRNVTVTDTTYRYGNGNCYHRWFYPFDEAAQRLTITRRDGSVNKLSWSRFGPNINVGVYEGHFPGIYVDGGKYAAIDFVAEKLSE